MVAVGDVGLGNELEHHAEGLDRGRAAHAPHRLVNAFLIGEVVGGLGGLRGLYQGLKRRVVAVGEKDRPCLATRRADVAHAVLFLVAARVLVAGDDAVRVVVDRARGHDAGLRAPALLKTVEVVAARAVAQEGLVLHALAQKLGRLGIDVVCVHVVIRREGRLGAVDRQEALGVGGHVLGGRGAVEDVVGQAREALGGRGRRRAVTGKGFSVHEGSLL